MIRKLRNISILSLLLTLLPGTLAAATLDCTIDGKKPESVNEMLSKITDSIPNNAAVNCSTSAQLIINVVEADDKGEPKVGSPMKVLIFQGGKGTLDNIMGGGSLASGKHRMNIVAEGQTLAMNITVK